METTRQKKFSRLIQKELAEHLLFLFRNKFAGTLVSVTTIRVTPDLQEAKVYISIFPADKQKLIMDELEIQKKTIKYEIGQKLKTQLRHIPELRYYVDDSLDYAEKIDNLLKN